MAHRTLNKYLLSKQRGSCIYFYHQPRYSLLTDLCLVIDETRSFMTLFTLSIDYTPATLNYLPSSNGNISLITYSCNSSRGLFSQQISLLTNHHLSFWLILSFFILCAVLKIAWVQNISCSVPSSVSLLLTLLQSTNAHLDSYLHNKGLLLSTLKKGYPKSQTVRRVFWVQGHKEAG